MFCSPNPRAAIKEAGRAPACSITSIGLPHQWLLFFDLSLWFKNFCKMVTTSMFHCARNKSNPSKPGATYWFDQKIKSPSPPLSLSPPTLSLCLSLIFCIWQKCEIHIFAQFDRARQKRSKIWTQVKYWVSNSADMLATQILAQALSIFLHIFRGQHLKWQKIVLWAILTATPTISHNCMTCTCERCKSQQLWPAITWIAVATLLQKR